MGDHDEYTFLCGYQRIRRYGSTSDVNESQSRSRKFSDIVMHEVQPDDTLQSLELKYNSSMFEIKRLNRLWSNNSLHCKTHLRIPVFNENNISTRLSKSPSHPDRIDSSNPTASDSSKEKGKNLPPLMESEESLDAFFSRIDSNMKKSKKAVRKLNRNFWSL